MARYTFFYNPMSRAQIARWALHEVAADYDSTFVAWDDKPRALLDANALGKLPTIIHHAPTGDRIVTEAAAICHYLAEAEGSDLLPRDEEKAAYFRWLFFAAGPLESAITARTYGWEVPADREVAIGFGSFERTVDAIDRWLGEHRYICGPRFTMADVYVGSQIDWGLQFGTLPDRESFRDYAGTIRQRGAYRAAKAIDNELIEQMQGSGGNPSDG